jgi:hypothetical protein
MELEITSYYCLCEELLSALNIEDNSQIKTNNAEVMTVLLTAAAFFGGHIRKSSNFLMEHGYITDIISESRMNRRLHAIDCSVWKSLFSVISEIFKKRNQAENTFRTASRCPCVIISGFPAQGYSKVRNTGDIWQAKKDIFMAFGCI